MAKFTHKNKGDEGDDEQVTSSNIDLNKLHDEAMRRHTKREQDKNRDPKNVLQREFDINVKESYKRSLALIEANENLKADEKELQIAHLESVLSAGACKYDR